MFIILGQRLEYENRLKKGVNGICKYFWFQICEIDFVQDGV